MILGAARMHHDNNDLLDLSEIFDRNISFANERSSTVSLASPDERFC